MKISVVSRRILLLAALTMLSAHLPQVTVADDIIKAIDVSRNLYASDRQAFLAEAMQFTESESAAFWPLYREYRAEQEKLGDNLLKLVLEYADVYPNVPEDRARELLKQHAALEKKLVSQRAWYLKKFARILPASKTLRLAQLENRLDLILRMQLASAIPLVPVPGELTGLLTESTAIAPGVPGGIKVETYELTATVTGLNPATRKVTLVGPGAIKKTIQVGPDAINFDQLRVGDQVNVTVAEELVVSLAGADELSGEGTAEVVVLAPKGTKPGGLMATTTQLTARVTALDLEKHQATLQFADGSTKKIAVRPDVDLNNRKVGEQVVIRVTEAMAISVQKP